MLKSLVGDSGVEDLKKAVFKRGTQAVIDPLEFYFPLMVMPRTILSWLVQNIKPMKPGEHKEVPFPGRDDIKIYIEKQDVDQYRAEFIQGSKVVHAFEKQSLPAVSAHLMTVGEIYDTFTTDPKEEAKIETPKEPLKEEQDSKEVVRTIMQLGEVAPQKEDPEQIKWMTSHASIKELTGVVGKLVDVLVAREITGKKADAELDKADMKESKEQGKVEESRQPEKISNENLKDRGLPAESKGGEFKAAIQEMKQITKDKYQPAEDNKGPECKEVPAGKEAAEGKIKKEEMSVKKRSVREVLMKPCGSTKKAEMPGGAAAPKGPAAPIPPKPPVPAGGMPQAQANKQAQASARGKVVMPKTPGAPMPHNSSNKPKAPAAPKAPGQQTPGAAAKPPQAPKAPVTKGEGYFRNKLSGISKSECYNVTESEVYKSKCKECGKPEFKKSDSGPQFDPCACFAVVKQSEDGKPTKFVDVIKKSDGTFDLKFDKNADPDSVKIFLLTLKSRLLLKRRHGL